MQMYSIPLNLLAMHQLLQALAMAHSSALLRLTALLNSRSLETHIALVLRQGLKPGAAGPQLRLQVRQHARQCMLLPQRAQVGQQPLVYGAPGHEREHLPGHSKHLQGRGFSNGWHQ